MNRRLSLRAALGAGGAGRASRRASIAFVATLGTAACGPLLGIDSVDRQNDAAGASGVGGGAAANGAGGTGPTPGGSGPGGTGGMGGKGGSGGGGQQRGFLRFANFDGGTLNDQLPDLGYDICIRLAGSEVWRGPLLAAELKGLPLSNGELTGHGPIDPGDYELRAVQGAPLCDGAPTTIDFEGLFQANVGVWATAAVVAPSAEKRELRVFLDGAPTLAVDAVDGRVTNVLSGEQASNARFEPGGLTVSHFNNAGISLSPGARLALEAVFLDDAKFTPEGEHFIPERLGQSAFLLTRGGSTQSPGLIACTNGPGASLEITGKPSPGCNLIELLPGPIPAPGRAAR